MTLQQLKEEAINELDKSYYMFDKNGLHEDSIKQLKDFIDSQIDKAYEEGKKESEFKVLNHFKKVEAEKWNDANHCSCLGYAIATYEDKENQQL